MRPQQIIEDVTFFSLGAELFKRRWYQSAPRRQPDLQLLDGRPGYVANTPHSGTSPNSLPAGPFREGNRMSYERPLISSAIPGRNPGKSACTPELFIRP